jgi:hypothetical protein
VFLGDPSTTSAEASPLLIGIIGASLGADCIASGLTQRTDWHSTQTFLKDQGVSL